MKPVLSTFKAFIYSCLSPENFLKDQFNSIELVRLMMKMHMIKQKMHTHTRRPIFCISTEYFYTDFST